MDFGCRTDTLTNKSAFGGKADMEKRYSTFGKSGQRAVKCLTGIDAVHITRVADVALDFLVFEVNLWITANGLAICRHSPARERGSIANNCSGKRTEGDPKKQSEYHAAEELNHVS